MAAHRDARSLAGTVPGMVGEVGGERLAVRSTIKSTGSVGMAAGAATANQRREPRDALGGLGRRDASGDLLDGCRDQGVQAVHAGSALAGALTRKPARDARGLGDGTGIVGQQQHDARAERGPVRGEVFVWTAPRRAAGAPPIQLPPYPPSSSARSWLVSGSRPRRRSARPAKRRARSHTPPGGRPAPASVTSADPGWEGVPSSAEPIRSVAGDQRDVGQRLGVVDEGWTAPYALLEGHRRGERRASPDRRSDG